MTTTAVEEKHAPCPLDNDWNLSSADLPWLFGFCRTSSPDSQQYHSAFGRIEYILQNMGLLPVAPPRLSEIAMAKADAERRKRTLVPPVKSLKEALATARDVRFQAWSQNFWGLMRSLTNNYDQPKDFVLAVIHREFDGREDRLVEIINDNIRRWNPPTDWKASNK